MQPQHMSQVFQAMCQSPRHWVLCSLWMALVDTDKSLLIKAVGGLLNYSKEKKISTFVWGEASLFLHFDITICWSFKIPVPCWYSNYFFLIVVPEVIQTFQNAGFVICKICVTNSLLRLLNRAFEDITQNKSGFSRLNILLSEEIWPIFR